MSEAPLTSEDIFLQYCQAKPDKATEFINDYILYCLDIANPFDSDSYSPVKQYILDFMVAFDKYLALISNEEEFTEHISRRTNGENKETDIY